MLLECEDISGSEKLCFEVLRSLLVVKEHVEHGDVVHGWVGGRHGYTCGVLDWNENEKGYPAFGCVVHFPSTWSPSYKGGRYTVGYSW